VLTQFFLSMTLLLVITLLVTYFDVGYRRIPNRLVLTTLLLGLLLNTFFKQWSGFSSSLLGCLLAFGLMLMLYAFGALGAGDVKLFAAIGSLIGVQLVLQTFVIVVFCGGLLALISMLYTGTAKVTMHRVWTILIGLLPGWEMPRYTATPDRHTIPYGVAITLGTLISFVFYTA
jgi:prepilin peptidase CpaA